MNLDRIIASLIFVIVVLSIILYLQQSDYFPFSLDQQKVAELEHFEKYVEKAEENEDQNIQDTFTKEPKDVTISNSDRLKAILEYEKKLKTEQIKKPLIPAKAPPIEVIKNKNDKKDKLWIKPDIYELASAKVGDLINVPLPESSPRENRELIIRISEKSKSYLNNREVTSIRGYIANTDSSSKQVYISIIGNSANIDVYDYNKIYSSTLTNSGGWMINASKTFQNINLKDDYIEISNN